MNYKILADVTYIARQKMFYLWSYSSDTEVTHVHQITVYVTQTLDIMWS